MALSTSVQVQTVHQGFVDLVHFVRRNFFCSSVVNGSSTFGDFCGSFTVISKGQMR